MQAVVVTKYRGKVDNRSACTRSARRTAPDQGARGGDEPDESTTFQAMQSIRLDLGYGSRVYA